VQTFIRLNDPAALKAAGLPWDSYYKAQWAHRRRHELGLADAFRRQGRNILVWVERARELLVQQHAA
jgi:hypothetical protein